MSLRRAPPGASSPTAACRRSRTPSARCLGIDDPLLRAAWTSAASSRWSMPSAASTSTSTQGFDDPSYDGFGGPTGFAITAGRASPRRARRARLRPVAQGRRRERLHAGRRASSRSSSRCATPSTAGGSAAVGAARTCSTRSATRSGPTCPVERLPELAADRRRDRRRRRRPAAVIRHPLVRSRSTRYGSSLVPDLAAIRGGRRRAVPATRAARRRPGRRPKPTKPPKAPSGGAEPRALTGDLRTRARSAAAPSGARPGRGARSRSSRPASTGRGSRPPGGSASRLEDRVVAEPAAPARRRRDPAAARPPGAR